MSLSVYSQGEDAAENEGLIFFKQKGYQQCSVLNIDALEAQRRCLELMDAKRKMFRRTKEGVKQYTNKRNVVLLELSVTLFYMTLLRERLGQIEYAVSSCEEARFLHCNQIL